MGAVRVRLVGGSLDGHVLWVDEGSGSVQVHVAGEQGARRTLQYRIDGPVGVFVEPEEAAEPEGTTPD